MYGSYIWSDVFFFFKQKTAYEMRISDWSSDVCSSDLRCPIYCCRTVGSDRWDTDAIRRHSWAHDELCPALSRSISASDDRFRSEERRVGKECVVRVDLGGRRIIKKKRHR